LQQRQGRNIASRVSLEGLQVLAVAENIGFAAHALSEMAHVVSDNQDKIERAWHEHFCD
jgi:hypothetical protein